MNQLMSNTENLTMSSREIAELTGKEHRNVLADIRKMLDELHGESGAANFSAVYKDQQLIDRPCFNLLKRETLILVSGYSIAMRAKIIDRWQELEVHPQKHLIPQTLPEALRLAADLSEQKAAVEAQLAIAVPKVEAYDRIATADGSLCLTDAAKELQMRPRDFISWLSANQWIYKRAGGSSWVGYQNHIQVGNLEHKSSLTVGLDGMDRIRDQVRVTGKGLAKLSSVMHKAAA